MGIGNEKMGYDPQKEQGTPMKLGIAFLGKSQPDRFFDKKKSSLKKFMEPSQKV